MKDNKLNVQDLMIGDWVMLKDYPMTAIPTKVIPQHFVRSLVELEPIPLTAEILEKNLSTTFQIQYCWDDFLSNSFGEDFYEIRYHGDVTELIISIRYVHELQHVLKLCKIEKEIIL